MRGQRHEPLAVLVAAIFLFSVAGCGARSTRLPGEGDADTDADTDVDTDVDRCYPRGPYGGTPYEIGDVVENRAFEGRDPPNSVEGLIDLQYFCEQYPAKRALLVNHYSYYADSENCLDVSFGLPSFHRSHESNGLALFLLASSFPNGMPFDLETGEVFFAGLGAPWALDPDGWGFEWVAGESECPCLVLSLGDMSVQGIFPTWDEAAIEEVVIEILEGT